MFMWRQFFVFGEIDFIFILWSKMTQMIQTSRGKQMQQKSLFRCCGIIIDIQLFYGNTNICALRFLLL